MSKFESEVFGGKAMLFLAFPACLFDDEMFSRRSNTAGGAERLIPSFLALVFGTRYAYLVLEYNCSRPVAKFSNDIYRRPFALSSDAACAIGRTVILTQGPPHTHTCVETG